MTMGNGITETRDYNNRLQVASIAAGTLWSITNSYAAEGLGAIDGEHLLIADTAASFTHSVVRLWNDPELRTSLGKAGRQRYEQHFTWPAAWSALEPRP